MPFVGVSLEDATEAKEDLESVLTDRITIQRAVHGSSGTAKSVTYAAVAGGPFKGRIFPGGGGLEGSVAGLIAADLATAMVEAKANLEAGDRMVSTQLGATYVAGIVTPYVAPDEAATVLAWGASVTRLLTA